MHNEIPTNSEHVWQYYTGRKNYKPLLCTKLAMKWFKFFSLLIVQKYSQENSNKLNVVRRNIYFLIIVKLFQK
jgi:hypothetical protein